MNIIDQSMFTVLLKEHNIKPRLKSELRFASEKILDWRDRDFLTILTRDGHEGLLIAPLDKFYVLPFHLQKRLAGRTGKVEAIICDFCATWQRGSNSAIITFSKNQSTISFLCCADLDCSLHVRDKTPVAALSRTQLREGSSVERRVERLQARLKTILFDIV
jgi:hypothetical protein